MNHWDKTPVTLLHELLAKRQLTPTYSLIYDGTGSHDPLFKYEVSGSGESAVGSGKSKKEAKHEAARLLLEKLSDRYIVKNEDEVDLSINSPYAEVIRDNAIGMLTEYCAEKNLRMPEYLPIRDEGLPHAKLFSYKCSVSSFTTEAQARTKKQAKQLAAQEMLNKLKECLDVNTASIQRTDNFEKSNEIVLKKLMEVRLKKGNSSEQLGIKIADYYKIFLDDAYPKSATLDTVKGQTRVHFEAMEDPEEFCKTILRELDFQYKVELLESENDSVATSLTIEGTPTWAFFGCDSTREKAVREVYVEALTFMSDMTKE